MATRKLERIVITYNDSLEADKIRVNGTLSAIIGGKDRSFSFDYIRNRSQLTTNQQSVLDNIAAFLNSYLNADEPLT